MNQAKVYSGVLANVSSTYGAKEELKELWEALIAYSLLSKALWHMYVKDLVLN